MIKRISLRLTEAEYFRIKEDAESLGISMSDFIIKQSASVSTTVRPDPQGGQPVAPPEGNLSSELVNKLNPTKTVLSEEDRNKILPRPYVYYKERWYPVLPITKGGRYTWLIQVGGGALLSVPTVDKGDGFIDVTDQIQPIEWRIMRAYEENAELYEEMFWTMVRLRDGKYKLADHEMVLDEFENRHETRRASKDS